MFGKEGGVGGREEEDGKTEEGDKDKEGGEESKAGTSVPVLLPEVQMVTGEEGEKKIVQVSIYSIPSHTWTWTL